MENQYFNSKRKISLWIRYALLLVISLIGQRQIAFSYDYDTLVKIQSLEGKVYTLNLYSNYADDILSVKIVQGKDSLCIHGFRGMRNSPVILGDKFLKVRFDIPGGSGVHNERTTILCISDGKSYDVLDFDSDVECFGGNCINKTCDVHEKFSSELELIKGKKLNNYQLIVKSTDFAKYKYDPSQNHYKKETTILKFNPNDKCFYNKTVFLIGWYSPDTDNNEDKSDINLEQRNYPVAGICKDQYYYINETWYYKQTNGRLYKHDIRCK